MTQEYEVLKKMMIPAIVEEEDNCDPIQYYKDIKIVLSRDDLKRWQAKIYVDNPKQYGDTIMDQQKLKELLDCGYFNETIMDEIQEIKNCYFRVKDDYIFLKNSKFSPLELNEYLEHIEREKDYYRNNYDKKYTYLTKQNFTYDYVTLEETIDACKILIERIIEQNKEVKKNEKINKSK